VLGLLAGGTPCRATEAGPGSSYRPRVTDLHVRALLDSAVQALADLEVTEAGIDRDSAFNAALSSLTELYEVYGCEWALPRLRELHRDPRRTQMLQGWAQGGKLSLRVEPLELQNPAFRGWTVLLVTLVSETSENLQAGDASALSVTLADGTDIAPERLSKGHKLWQKLGKMAGTFKAPEILPSGQGKAYKQLFALPRESFDPASASLRWGGMDLSARRY
jgi:hypothetical protein